jgi:hypothetical protein
MWVGMDLLAADILVGKEHVTSWFGMAVAYIQAQRKENTGAEGLRF